MNIYAIFANDNLTGTSYKLFNKAIETLKEQGHSVDELLLYERAQEIPFFKHSQDFMESHPFYLENKERFLQADALLLVFPLFWYSVPGILKAWLDMINGWAYKYESGIHAQPLHSIKKALIIYTSMQPKEYLNKELCKPVENQLTETLKFIGIPEIEIYLVDNVNQIDTEKLAAHLEQITRL
jgi:NAD(P)H dehydrogenase (quinone)